MKTFRTKKNYLIRIIAAIFTVAAVFSALIFFALHFYNSSISYTSSGFAPANDILNNPYCGWYDMFGYTISDACADTFDKRTQDYIQKSGSTRLVLLEINLKNFNNTELSDNALAQIDRIFTMWGESPHAVILRFLYDWDGKAMQTEPDSIETVKLHMKQTSDIVNNHKNSIYIMQGIFVGSFAEMHSSHYMDTNSMTELALLLDSLIDDDIYLSVRTPQHLRTIFKTADISKLKSDGHRIRTGLFNDGMLGSYIDVGTYGPENYHFSDEEYDKKGNRSQEIAFQDELCLLVPNGGEVVLDNKYNDIDNAAKDLASMHVSYLNNAHDLTVINKWKKQTYTDPDGDSVYNGMSAYDYVTTRLGYRYCLLSSSFEHKNNAFGGSLQITLKNEGFAPSYKDFDVELFIIKDDNSAAPTDSYSAAADNTDIVYSENLTEKYPASTWTPGNEINLDISIPLLQIKKAGNITKVNNYSIYLVVRDKISGEIIKFANDASYNDYGYYIGSLKI